MMRGQSVMFRVQGSGFRVRGLVSRRGRDDERAIRECLLFSLCLCSGLGFS